MTSHLRAPGEGTLTVRAFAPDEWAGYRDVRLAALTDAPSAFASTAEAERAFPEELWRTRLAAGGTFGAWLGDRAVGTVAGLTRDARPGRAELVAMWVAPEVRGRGVGEALVEAVVSWARDQGCDAVGLWVMRGNASAARLYARTGFTVTSEVDVEPDDPCRDEVRMVRALGAAALT